MIVSNKELNDIAWIDTAGSYEFDTVIILKDPETGKYFAGHDSGCSCPIPFGCSCPIPFENMGDLSDWTEIHSKNEAIDFAKRNLISFSADDLINFMTQLNNNWN